jgi:tetratricopeptide (TPR) repeat protein
MSLEPTHKGTHFKVRPDIWICLFISIATLAVYFQVRHHEFINLDDGLYILNNPQVGAGLTFKSIAWAFRFPGLDYWRPLTWLSHMLDCHIYGLDPGMHHQTSLIIHVVNSMLLFLVFKWMTGTVWQSAFVATLFALHPMNVESVAWVAERKNVLSAFFWLLTMSTYLYYSKRPNLYRYLVICIVFALGLMSKPMLVTLPFVLILLDYWPLCRIEPAKPGGDHRGGLSPGTSGFRPLSIMHLVLEKIPLLILSLIGVLLSSVSVQHLDIAVSTDLIPTKLRISNALVSYVKYIFKMIWPHNLSVYYPFPQTIQWWKVAGASLLVLGISVLALRVARSKPYFLVGWFWYAGTLLPAIGLVQAGLWPAIADRFAYIPLVGLFLIIAWGGSDSVARWRYKEILLTFISAALLAVLMVTTYLQVGYWRNSITIFERALEVTDNNHVAHHKLGDALDSQGNAAEAIRHYSKALQIKPDFLAAHINLGIVLNKMDKPKQAMAHLAKALSLKPDYAEAHNELGVALKKQGRFDEAIKHYLEALRIKPDDEKAHNNLGVALARKGDNDTAIYHFYEALRINSNYPDAYFNLGKIFSFQGKDEASMRYYRTALQHNPNMAQALYSLSWTAASHDNIKFRNGEEAVKLAERLCRITQYNQPLALDALAAAYAETGRFDAAVSTAQKALELALAHSLETLALELKKRIQLYQAGRPYRQASPEKDNQIVVK